MRSTLSLINKYFWRGYIGPIFAYFVPLVLTIFIGRITGPSLIVPGVFIIPFLSILLIFMPQSIFEFRNSTLIKRIGNTPIKPIRFLLAIAIFNSIIVISAFLFIFLCSFIIFYDSLSDTLDPIKLLDGSFIYRPTFMFMIKHADWGSYIYSQLVLIVETILIGLIFSSIARSSLFIQATGISVMLISLFLGPCVLPVSMVAKIDIVKWFGYFLPLKYPIASSIEAFTSGANGLINNLTDSKIFDVNSTYMVANVMINDLSVPFEPLKIYDHVDKILNLAMPYCFILIFIYLVSATFRWNNRGKVKFRWNVIMELKKFFMFNSKKVKNDTYYKSNPKSKYILEVDDLCKSFKINNKTIIHANNHISFKLEKNKNLAILGANGAGKTVLTELILGIDKPDKGTISYNYKFNKTFKEGIGIQFQDSVYPYGIKTKDVVNFFINAYKLKLSNEEKNELIDKFGVRDYWNKNISNLSGGQKQRINLLLAIIHKPKIIFLDELSTGLDIKIKSDIKKFIKEFAKKNNINIIIVSHDMQEVMYLCDEIIILREGKIIERTTTKDVIKKFGKDFDKFLMNYL